MPDDEEDDLEAYWASVRPKPSSSDPAGSGEQYQSPVFCEHANEVPGRCPCPANCYCKRNTCRPRPV